MSDLFQLKAQRCTLVDDLIELAAIDMALDVSEPLPALLRDVVYSEVMVAYQAWCDLVAMNAYVEATSPLEKGLLELCHLDRTLRFHLRNEESRALPPSGPCHGQGPSDRELIGPPVAFAAIARDYSEAH
jgi:hypothetical protein